MSNKRSVLSWLSQFLDVRGLVTSVVAGLVLLGLLAVRVAPVRNGLERFFTTETWVWTLVSALVVEAGLFGAVVWFRGRRRTAASQRVWKVSYGGVSWPVTRYWNAPGYKVDPPVCPIDGTQLGLVRPGVLGGKPVPVAHVPQFWALRSDALKFKCLKCDGPHDLSGLDYGMDVLREIVEQRALGEARARRG